MDGLALVVVVLHGRDKDVAHPQPVGKHPGGDKATPRDRQQQVEFLPTEPLGQPGDEIE